MKKSCFILLLLSAILFSCSNMDYEKTIINQPEEQNSQLLIDLRKINDDFVNDYDKSRSWSFKEICRVVAADAQGACSGGKGGAGVGRYVGLCLGSPIQGEVAGAIVGALVCGSISSWIASPDRCSDGTLVGDSIIKSDWTGSSKARTINRVSSALSYVINDCSDITEDIIIEKIPEMYEEIHFSPEEFANINLSQEELNVGLAHNIILGILDNNVEVPEQSNLILQQPQDSLMYNTILRDKRFEQKCIQVIDEKDNLPLSLPDDVLNLYIDTFVFYMQHGGNPAMYINAYTNAVNNSNELTDEEKQSLRFAFATSLYSYKYWYKKQYPNI